MSSHNRDFNAMTIISSLFNLALYGVCVSQKDHTIILIVGGLAALIQCTRLIIYAAETSYTFNLQSKMSSLKVQPETI